jgi:dihydropteroate synthase
MNAIQSDPVRAPAKALEIPPLAWGRRTLVMGILNVTPDSFFDGGRHNAPPAAGERARRLEAEGADWIDIGAESSRPGAAPVSEAEELRRLLPVVEVVRSMTRRAISVDTTRASVARAALAAGATWVNDIRGLQGDPEMAGVVAGAGASVVIMHNQRGTDYPDGLIPAINRYFEAALQIAGQAGIAREQIVLDPGIGFGKTPEQNLAVLRQLRDFRSFGLPLLLGASRKSVIGHVLDLPVGERLEGSLATTVAAVAAGFDAVRVHDVQEHVRVARMADAIYRISHG